MILKHPDVFTLVASWDFPADMSTYTEYGARDNYGTDANFQANYRLTQAFVDAHKAPFTTNNRIWIGGYNIFQQDVVDYNALLTSEGIAHTLGPMQLRRTAGTADGSRARSPGSRRTASTSTDGATSEEVRAYDDDLPAVRVAARRATSSSTSGNSRPADCFPAADDPGPDAVYPLQMWLCATCGLAQLVADPTLPEEPRAVEPAALMAQARDAVESVAAAGYFPAGATVAEYASPHGGSWLEPLSATGPRSREWRRGRPMSSSTASA